MNRPEGDIVSGHAVTIVAIALDLEPPLGVDRLLHVPRDFMRHQSGGQGLNSLLGPTGYEISEKESEVRKLNAL
jgi:hypothetical protein